MLGLERAQHLVELLLAQQEERSEPARLRERIERDGQAIPELLRPVVKQCICNGPRRGMLATHNGSLHGVSR